MQKNPNTSSSLDRALEELEGRIRVRQEEELRAFKKAFIKKIVIMLIIFLVIMGIIVTLFYLLLK